jgi:hypothetical protein
MLTHPVANMNAIARRKRALMLRIGDTDGSETWTTRKVMNGLAQRQQSRFVAHIECAGDPT